MEAALIYEILLTERGCPLYPVVVPLGILSRNPQEDKILRQKYREAYALDLR